MNKRIFASSAGLAIAAATIVGMAGCSTTSSAEHVTSHGDGSRVEFYSSVDALASDSSIVVAGTVTDQHVAQDIPNGGDFTLSTVTVTDTPKADDAHPAGTTLTVRQIGSADEVGPATLLEPGQTYLLYLTPSGLDGDLASQFYVTGGSAGLYVATDAAAGTNKARAAVAADATFSQVQPDEGDSLPEEVTLDGADG